MSWLVSAATPADVEAHVANVHRWTIGVAAVALVVLWVFPPFMVIDMASDGARHAPLSHRPFWSPPTPEAAAERLDREFGPSLTGGLDALRIGRNDVGLAVDTVLVLAAAAVAALGARRRTRRIQRRQRDDADRSA